MTGKRTPGVYFFAISVVKDIRGRTFTASNLGIFKVDRFAAMFGFGPRPGQMAKGYFHSPDGIVPIWHQLSLGIV